MGVIKMQEFDAMFAPEMKEIEELTSQILRKLETKGDPDFGLKWRG